MSGGAYDDIIRLPHHVSARRKPMEMAARAAQFASFAALSGHDEAIAESGRATTRQIELSDDMQQTLSRRIAYAMSLPHPAEADITYFRPDPHKAGGTYVTLRKRIKKVEKHLNRLTFTDGTEIPLDAITDIRGEIFDDSAI